MPTDKKISELPVATSINAADTSVLVNGGTDYQYTFTLLLQFLEANLNTGAKISFGTALPQNTSGNNGDVFVNTSAGSFAQKVSGTWTVVYTLPAANAADGALLYGAGVPGSSTGKNSDSYINTLTGIFYKKSSGTWAQVFSMATGPQGPQGTAGTNGTNGTDGNTILFGSANPSNSTTGIDGNFYINTNTYTLFGPKTAGDWGDGISLVGTGIQTGGTAGQILVKADATDFNTEWEDNSFANLSGQPGDNPNMAAALADKQNTLGFTPENIANKNIAGGYAGLDGGGKVAAAQLPSYVDDVLEYANFAALPGTGETGKIYVTLDTNKEYRWSGSTYIQLVASPGSTDSVPEGSTNLYFTAARVLAVVLNGLSFGTVSAVTATDSILVAFGKLQAQINNLFFAGGVLTGYASTTGTITATDTILSAVGKLNGNMGALPAAVWGSITGSIGSQTDLQNTLAAKLNALVPTAVKTGAYTLAASDYVPVNTTSGTVPLTLPTAPANGTIAGAKMVIQSDTNTATITTGGSDVFNKLGGSTIITLSLVNQGLILLYNSGIWHVLADDLPLSALDTRYLTSSSSLSWANVTSSPTTLAGYGITDIPSQTGNSGKYLTTNDSAMSWATISGSGMSNPMTATGDIIFASSGSTPARLAIGSSGQILTVVSGAPAWQTLGTSIYTADGSLSGNRTITLSSHTFTLSDSSPAIYLANPAYSGSYITSLGSFGGGTGQLILGNNGTNCIQAGTTGTGGSLNIYTNCTNAQGVTPNGNLALAFTAAGNATFGYNAIVTGSLTVNGSTTFGNVGFGTGSGGAVLTISGAGTNTMYQKFNNGGGNYYIGVSSSTGDGLMGTSSNYAFCMQTESARDLIFGTTNTERMRIWSNGRMSINSHTDDAVNMLQVNGSVVATQLRISALNADPSSSTDTGTIGEIRLTSTYIYLCTATNTWVRVAFSLF